MKDWEFDKNLGLKYTYESLESEDPIVRRESVYILLDILPEDAIPHLEKVTKDKQWEIRFYAKQAIKLIEAK